MKRLSQRAGVLDGAAFLMSAAIEAPCAAEAVVQDAPRFGILPASVLRNESTAIAKSLLPDFSAEGWVGLVCGAARCELRPLTLGVLYGQSAESEDIGIVHHPRPVRRKPVKSEYTIALLNGFARVPGAPIPTWFTLRTPRVPRDAASGSLGMTIQAPGGATWQIVPRWNAKGSDDFLTFYLETKGPHGPMRRQSLGRISLAVVQTGVSPKDVLVWAGDLDRDGKIDLITRMDPKSMQPGLQLWLSTLAQGDSLVGSAAELSVWTDVEAAE